jgi:3-oxoacyl-[acyl-carrier protein] reductase
MTASLDEKVKEEALKGISLGRFGQPADVANAAVFLAGDTAAYITAQVLVVDGGMIA